MAIVTPNHAHAPAAKAFLKAGIHVICDKPLTTTRARGGSSSRSSPRRPGSIFAVTHNYTGYPLVRQARAMVQAGELGAIRVVQVEYAQDWLATRLEETGQKQAAWRTDPARSGPAGSVGDIGTHAFNLAEFIAGDEVTELSAELHTFVAGRRLDDNAHMMLRFANGREGHAVVQPGRGGPGERPAHPRLRREGRPRVAPGESEPPRLHAARRAAAR